MPEYLKRLRILVDQFDQGYTIEKGEAMAVHPSLRGAPFYPVGTSFDRAYAVAQRERITLASEQDLLSDSFERLRFSGIQGSILFVGSTHYGEAQLTNKAAIGDTRIYSLLRESGVKDYHDPRAYFSYPFGVTAVTLSVEGHIIVFRRSSTMEFYPSHWSTVGGGVDGDYSFWEASNPSSAFRNQVDRQMLLELHEEVGICPSELSLHLTGLIDCLSSATFTYTANARLPAEEIIHRQKEAEDTYEHIGSLVIKTPGELCDFFRREECIAPAGAGSLLLYLKKKDPEAFDFAKKSLHWLDDE